MPSIDWDSFLRTHPIFQRLTPHERKTFLSKSFSIERVFKKGDVILKEGDTANSIFLIGTGSVSVEIRDFHGDSIHLYSLGESEIFGEMALIEQRPRSATVVAGDPATLLEIDGEKFLKLMSSHAEIALFLLGSLSQRLRHLDRELLSSRVKGLDETIERVNQRLDGIAETMDAKLVACQTMFEQTSTSASQILKNADRSRNTLQWIVGIVTAVLSLGAAYGFFSIKSIEQDIKRTEIDVREYRDAVVELQKETQASAESASKATEEILSAKDIAVTSSQAASESRRVIDDALQRALGGAGSIDVLNQKIGVIAGNAAYTSFRFLYENPQNEEQQIDRNNFYYIFDEAPAEAKAKLVTYLHQKITASENERGRNSFVNFFDLVISNKEEHSPDIIVNAYYFKALALIKKSDSIAFNAVLSEMSKYVSGEKRRFNHGFDLFDLSTDYVKQMIGPGVVGGESMYDRLSKVANSTSR